MLFRRPVVFSVSLACEKELNLMLKIFRDNDRTTLSVIHHMTRIMNVCYSGHGLNNEPFDELTVLDHLNTKQVCHSDPHCILKLTKQLSINTLAKMYSTFVTGPAKK